MSQRHITDTEAIKDVECTQIALNFVPSFDSHEDGNLASAVQALNVVDTPYPGVALPDMPNPLTDSAKQTIARSLDDMRELEAMDLNVEDGIGEVPGARTSKTVP